MMSRSFSGTRSIQTWLGSLSALAISSEEELETSPHVPAARAAVAARATNLDDFDIGQMVTQLVGDGKVGRHAAAYTQRKSASGPLLPLQRNREQYSGAAGTKDCPKSTRELYDRPRSWHAAAVLLVRRLTTPAGGNATADTSGSHPA